MNDDPWRNTPQWRMALLWAWWRVSRLVGVCALRIDTAFRPVDSPGRAAYRQYHALTATWLAFRAMMARDLRLQ